MTTKGPLSRYMKNDEDLIEKNESITNTIYERYLLSQQKVFHNRKKRRGGTEKK
jgi:hypothetical protein